MTPPLPKPLSQEISELNLNLWLDLWASNASERPEKKKNEGGGKESPKDSCRGLYGLSTLLMCIVSTRLSALAPALLSGDPEFQEKRARTQEQPSPCQT